ncbi:MAG: hypothetical protein V3R27_00825, partial [Pseudomonadales bacterium]
MKTQPTCPTAGSHARFRGVRPLAAAICLLSATTTALAQEQDQTVVQVATELRLSPEALVIVDVDAINALKILDRVLAHPELHQALIDAHQVADQAGDLVTELAEVITNGAADDAALVDYEAAVVAFEAANAKVVLVRDALFDTAVEGLQPDVIVHLDVWATGAPYRVTPEFRAAQRTADQWKQLERALRAEARALRMGEDLDPAYAELLSSVRGEFAVVEAAARLASNL